MLSSSQFLLPLTSLLLRPLYSHLSNTPNTSTTPHTTPHTTHHTTQHICKDNNANPTWDESFYLYVRDPSSAVLSLRVMDKDIFKEDGVMGVGAISVKELQVHFHFYFSISFSFLFFIFIFHFHFSFFIFIFIFHFSFSFSFSISFSFFCSFGVFLCMRRSQYRCW